MQAFELELTRLTLAYAAWEAIAFAIGMWVLYYVIKCAIRDGIRESGLAHDWTRIVRASQQRDRSQDTLPDMRAER